MAATNRDRVGRALDVLSDGLAPYVQRELRSWVDRQGGRPDDWLDLAARALAGDGPVRSFSPTDTQFQLKAMQVLWQGVFGRVLGRAERTYVNELIDTRNRWAHQEPFSTDDTYRALDTMQRLLTAIAAEQAAEIERRKQDLMRVRYEEQAKKAAKDQAPLVLEGIAVEGVSPWREVVTPHPDVASGRYQQAEFAADLAQVHRGEGSEEYRDPTEFFRRTYLTAGLQTLLRNAAERMMGKGGDPIVDLQTNFGGGKTHSLLALYHLFSGARPGALPGVEELLASVGDELPDGVRRVVLVGTWLSPGQAQTKPDGTVVRTLWGELAWQLGGAEAFGRLAEADATGTNPGTELLADLFGDGPTLILIDEWVAYARQLYGKEGLPAGTFDAHFTFAQSLTEAAKAAPRTLVVISIPASDGVSSADDPIGSEIEVGGEGGRRALERLKNVIGRAEAAWQPARAEESFEIVRRRLFSTITDTETFAKRDAVAKAFSDYYRQHEAEFPADCREAAYQDRIKRSYPIHPELFDRLYDDWSTLERFQRTRGVLRLMAAVIHWLWDTNDRAPLIMPASVPIAAAEVSSELTRYLEDNWRPVIETDIDGEGSTPRRLDQENPSLGRYQACRRVARAVYLGSAPTLKSANRGIEDRRIKLGCALPGESPAVFGDALRRLTDHATHLYVDESHRYWFATQPSVARLAMDRAGQLDTEDAVWPEIVRALREDRDRAVFPAVQVAPTSTAEIPDEATVRLVVFGPDRPHTARTAETAALAWAQEVLERRGPAPRRSRNMVVFLAPDRTRLDEFEVAARQALAWQSIWDEREQLNLDAFGTRQAETKLAQARDAVRRRIPETWWWVLVPDQPDPTGPVTWHTTKTQSGDTLAGRTAKRLLNDGLLAAEYGATLLRADLDRVPLWRGDHVSVRQLWEDYAQYLYLQRLPSKDVLIRAVGAGAASLSWSTDTFAYAESWDEDSGRYRGLVAGSGVASVLDDGLVVRAEVAARQLESEREAEPTPGPDEDGEERPPVPEPGKDGDRPAPPPPTRFYGHVALDPLELSTQAGKIHEAVVAFLQRLDGADVKLTLDVEATRAAGFPDDVVRTVSENANTLKFQGHGFEEA